MTSEQKNSMGIPIRLRGGFGVEGGKKIIPEVSQVGQSQSREAP